jgi:hypothetical protein
MITKDQIQVIDGKWDETNSLFTGNCQITYPNGEVFKGDVE